MPPLSTKTTMNTLIQDLRYGVRILLKQPGFTLVAVITLALGIGANTAIFSLVNSILLRPLPFRDPDRIVRLIQASPKLGLASWGVSQADFAAYSDQNRSFETVALYNSGAINLTGAGEPERLPMTSVTADFFKVFGVNPLLGRTFAAGEDAQGKNSVCVLSYSFWQRRFGGDKNIVGRIINLNNTPTEVVGVMPAEFKFPRFEIDLWTPLALNTTRTAPYFFTVVGRLKPGIQVAQAQADTTEILQNFGRRDTHRVSTQRRHESKQQTGQHTETSGKGEHTPAQTHFFHSHDAGDRKFVEHAYAQRGQAHSEDRADDGQQDAFS